MDNYLQTTSTLHFYTILVFGNFHEYTIPLITLINLSDRGWGQPVLCSIELK